MNPKEFNWTAEQQVTVTNPTSKDFRFQVHSKSYEVPSVKTVKMPGFIAWTYVYKMAIRLALDAGDFDKWNEDGIHQKYYDKVVVNVEEVIQRVAEAEEAITTFTDEDIDSDPLGGESGDDDEGGDKDPMGSKKIKPMEKKRRGRSPAKTRGIEHG